MGSIRKEEMIVTKLKIGHTKDLIWKHPTGNCDHYPITELVHHALFPCSKYSEENVIQQCREKKTDSSNTQVQLSTADRRNIIMNV